MPNSVIAGKYQVLRKLGEGTFGDVFLVQHADLSTKYAIKVLKKVLSTNEGFVSRFKREAEILLRFHHAGSVQLRDFGRTEDGLYYMATDFCDGQSLEDILSKRGRLEIGEALKLIIEVLEIVGAAHDFGIIHRDIKPGNIINNTSHTGKSEIQILDFGIASLRDEALAQYTNGENLTSYGTPVYMSPEQCAAEADIDHRADIYACGIMLYELLSGWVPFDSQDVLQILLKHLTQPPPSFPKQFGIPLSLEQTIFKALEKDRSARYDTAQEFANACRAQLEMIEPRPVRPVSSPTRQEKQNLVVNGKDLQKSDKRVLCLDDNEMILQIMKHLLESEGFHVFIANNFATIHDYVFEEHVPLMICDVNMPGLPGNKICQMLKQAKPEMRIVLFSNIPERDLERLAKESNADDWLSKNSKPNLWIERIKSMVGV